MQKRAIETREHILQTAQLLFASEGYDATGVAEICQRAGVSKGAFYHHFPTKQAVFMALLNEWLAGLNAQMKTLLDQAGSIPQGLIDMARVSHEVFRSAKGQLPMFLEFWHESGHDPAVWKATIEPYRHYTDLFAGVIRQGIEEGALRAVDPQQAARVVVALALGLVLQGVMDPEGAAWDEVAQQGMRFLIDGLARRNE